MREEYTSKDGNTIDQIAKDKVYVKKLLIILGSIFLIILVFFITRSILQNNTCKEIIHKVENASLEYAKESGNLPTSEGDYINFELDDLIKAKKITKEDVTVNEEVATGKIKVTKYKDEHIVTVELFKCSYCDTTDKKWGKETSKKPNKPIVDVIAYYNYQKKSTNFTKWTGWILNSQLNAKADKTYDVRLPKEDSNLPSIPKDAEIVSIEQEKKEYYRYRDLRCKYYKAGGTYTDFFSSEKPDGYENFDKSTEKYTEWTEFSLSYPEKKSYRSIDTKTGYKWYYTDKKGNKVYYKNGTYAVEVVSDKKYVRDTKAGSTQMYRYRDKQWRWYNGEKRRYSGYSAGQPKGYPYKDSELCEYGSWSKWQETSKVTTENMSYRTEEVDTRYRYRIKYEVLSLPVLSEDVPKDEFEQIVEQNIDTILKRDDLKVTITYKFRVKK